VVAHVDEVGVAELGLVDDHVAQHDERAFWHLEAHADMPRRMTRGGDEPDARQDLNLARDELDHVSFVERFHLRPEMRPGRE
jgi:hypothetical protein